MDNEKLDQEKYEVMGLQQPGKAEYENWDADMDGVVSVEEWTRAQKSEV